MALVPTSQTAHAASCTWASAAPSRDRSTKSLPHSPTSSAKRLERTWPRCSAPQQENFWWDGLHPVYKEPEKQFVRDGTYDERAGKYL